MGEDKTMESEKSKWEEFKSAIYDLYDQYVDGLLDIPEIEDERVEPLKEDLFERIQPELDDDFLPALYKVEGKAPPVNESNTIELIDFYRKSPEDVKGYYDFLYDVHKDDTNMLEYLHGTYNIVGGRASRIDELEEKFQGDVENITTRYEKEREEIINWMTNMDHKSPYLGLFSGVSVGSILAWIDKHGWVETGLAAGGIAIAGTLLGYVAPHIWGNYRLDKAWSTMNRELQPIEQSFYADRQQHYDHALDGITQLREDYGYGPDLTEIEM